ncbi:MAG: DUF1015 domain-containing protein [Spirochaetales bacterium]|nr:DUF1015 domain-containing protein [Spirochaetales bacterium]
MKSSKEKLSDFGVKVPEIMLPEDSSLMDKWAVIACDQYTSQKDYWKKVSETTENTPSTLNLIFPECYLEEPEPEKRIEKINSTMKEYIDKNILSKPESGFILVKRDTPNVKGRWGLIAALDLEKYDFSKGSKSLIRATEGTIIERIPPRVKIRKNAPLELPHIMVLIDDRQKTIIEPLAEKSDSLKKVYDFDLMMNSGHIEGFRVDSEKDIEQIAEAISQLGSKETIQQKYGNKDAFLFAMGDGNHSLATAKTIWENYKKENTDLESKELMNHPSRWALVEIVNIFSDGIEFEAIHRVLFNIEPENFLNALEVSNNFNVIQKNNLDDVIADIEKQTDKQLCGFTYSGGYGIIEAVNPTASISAGTFQEFIDNYLKDKPKASVDYIHGIDVTSDLGMKNNNIGLFLPSIDKQSFFQTVIDDGAFPRKTFSMGEAFEKRFYLEARKII